MDSGMPRYIHEKGAMSIPALVAKSWILRCWQLIVEIEIFAKFVMSPVDRPKVDTTSSSPEMSCWVGLIKSATSSV
jgi:hypothetical protein